MRYHHEESLLKTSMYGELYLCDHPVYSRCTLFRVREKGLAVIQQSFDPVSKSTYWTELDAGLADIIYLSAGFIGYFTEKAGLPKNGVYPTVTVRQIMWAIRLKPLPKERWETVFDRKDI